MNNEDRRYWLYRYEVSYEIGYECTVGFNDENRSELFYRLLKEAQEKFYPGYRQSESQSVVIGVYDIIWFGGWSATAEFREWGTNRTYRNYPISIELIDKAIAYVVDGMGGKVTGRRLYEMPIEMTDVSGNLALPMRKDEPTLK